MQGIPRGCSLILHQILHPNSLTSQTLCIWMTEQNFLSNKIEWFHKKKSSNVKKTQLKVAVRLTYLLSETGTTIPTYSIANRINYCLTHIKWKKWINLDSGKASIPTFFTNISEIESMKPKLQARIEILKAAEFNTLYHAETPFGANLDWKNTPSNDDQQN